MMSHVFFCGKFTYICTHLMIIPLGCVWEGVRVGLKRGRGLSGVDNVAKFIYTFEYCIFGVCELVWNATGFNGLPRLINMDLPRGNLRLQNVAVIIRWIKCLMWVNYIFQLIYILKITNLEWKFENFRVLGGKLFKIKQKTFYVRFLNVKKHLLLYN